MFVYKKLAAASCAALVAACAAVRDPVPTGVVTTELGRRQIRIVATGRAERSTIESGNSAMMRTTSCDAARLLLKNELKNPSYQTPGKNFREDREVGIIYQGEYCRISGTYDPAGKFESTNP